MLYTMEKYGRDTLVGPFQALLAKISSFCSSRPVHYKIQHHTTKNRSVLYEYIFSVLSRTVNSSHRVKIHAFVLFHAGVLFFWSLVVLILIVFAARTLRH